MIAPTAVGVVAKLKQIEESLLRAPAGVVQRGVAVTVGGVHERMRLDERRTHLAVTHEGRAHEWRVAVTVGGAGIGPQAEERTHVSQLASLSNHHQRCDSILKGAVDPNVTVTIAIRRTTTDTNTSTISSTSIISTATITDAFPRTAHQLCQQRRLPLLKAELQRAGVWRRSQRQQQLGCLGMSAAASSGERSDALGVASGGFLGKTCGQPLGNETDGRSMATRGGGVQRCATIGISRQRARRPIEKAQQQILWRVRARDSGVQCTLPPHRFRLRRVGRRLQKKPRCVSASADQGKVERRLCLGSGILLLSRQE